MSSAIVKQADLEKFLPPEVGNGHLSSGPAVVPVPFGYTVSLTLSVSYVVKI